MGNVKWALGAVILLITTQPLLANTEFLEDSDQRQIDIRPMGFAECTELIRDYEKDVGPAKSVLEAPGLRIVEFLQPSINEEIACDGDDNVISEIDLSDD